MPGDGPYLWLDEKAPPAGFARPPRGGMCISAFLFVQRDGKVLLGKYRDRPEWEALAGLEPPRLRRHLGRWTIPARQLKFGEDPREAARQIGEEILLIRGMRYSEPRVEVDHWKVSETAYWGPENHPGEYHYDIWFFVDAFPRPDDEIAAPPWYEEIAWQEPGVLPASAYGRFHEDVIARWLATRARP